MEHLIAEYADGVLLREYVWLGWRPVAVIEGGVTHLIRTDHIGRPLFATEVIAGLPYEAWRADYLPFGAVHISTGPLTTARFPGQWFQLEAGLHQNWMRDYDPTLGRYIQADPLGLVDGASVYGYALQQPGRFVDPRGLNSSEAIALDVAESGGQGFGFPGIGRLASWCLRGAGGFITTVLTPTPLGDGTVCGPRPDLCGIVEAVTITPDREEHILGGDPDNPNSGGHRAGTGRPGKTEFPPDWADGSIIDAVIDVANNGESVRPGNRPGREVRAGSVDGIDIEVVVDTNNDTVVTGYPVGGDGVVQNPW